MNCENFQGERNHNAEGPWGRAVFAWLGTRVNKKVAGK